MGERHVQFGIYFGNLNKNEEPLLILQNVLNPTLYSHFYF